MGSRVCKLLTTLVLIEPTNYSCYVDPEDVVFDKFDKAVSERQLFYHISDVIEINISTVSIIF